MTIYAKVVNSPTDASFTVVDTIVAEASFFDTFTDQVPGEWIEYKDQKQRPGKGWSYDPATKEFIPQQPFPSWTLNKTKYDWEPPVAPPDGVGDIYWDEDSKSWKSY